MKTGLFCFLVAVLAGSLALSQTTPDTPAKKTTRTTVTKKKSATGVSGAKTTSSKTAGAKKKTAARKKTIVTSAPRQMAPSADRYREIQQVLAQKGYLKSEPNGVWDDRSTEALKQFQTDQHLSPTGKISSLSLIDLGLGPKNPAEPASLPAPAVLQGSHPPDPVVDLPPPPETLPAPEN